MSSKYYHLQPSVEQEKVGRGQLGLLSVLEKEADASITSVPLSTDCRVSVVEPYQATNIQYRHGQIPTRPYMMINQDKSKHVLK